MGQWYKDFVTKCPDTEAKIDYSALHFYNTRVAQLGRCYRDAIC